MTGDPVLGGKSDEEVHIEIIKHLARKYPAKYILHEPFIIIREDSVDIYTNIDFPPPVNSMIHHPDILVITPDQKIRFIIEVDGSYHNSKAGRRSTEKRNRHYRAAGIPLIIVTPENWEKELKPQLESIV